MQDCKTESNDFILFQNNLERLLSEKSHVTLAIDGRCGGGKSTLAESLSSRYPCNIIHMDDFFLSPDLRTPERLALPGGNIHYERFLEEVAPCLETHSSGSYRIYSCKSGEYANAFWDGTKPLTLVEGVYSMRPELRHLYDCSLFVDVDWETQQKRLLHRGGAETLNMFQTKWIPLEEAYFSYYDIEAICSYRIRLTDNIVL